MSEQEQRTIRAMALLEVEEARRDLALLQAKAGSWYRLHEKVSQLLSRIRRTELPLERAAAESRAAVLSNKEEIENVLDLDAILALDDALIAAVSRLNTAMQNKKSLGFD